jgi:beta-lactamase superfamily II metal-dependent hydrolase
LGRKAKKVTEDYFEIDFLAVETAKSGDAIAIRYRVDGEIFVHVTDGGFSDMGPKIVDHLNTYYGAGCRIDHVVLTHSDGDHARGLKYVLENADVGVLWMNRPWLYAEELIDRFATYNSVNALRSRLRKCYPTVEELENIAIKRGIPIFEAFQGAQIGQFHVMSPPKSTYLDLIVDSEKTPEGIDESEKSASQKLIEAVTAALAVAKNFVSSLWGDEVFSPNETSAENEMSVVQAARICGKTILLTGDTGRRGLQEVIDYAPQVGLTLPGIDRFQVPHHGSRRNVNTDLLDKILGERLPNQNHAYSGSFTAVVSSAKADEHHPRKSVERAMIHRGAHLVATEGQNICSSHNAPKRAGWSSVASRPYPTDQES